MDLLQRRRAMMTDVPEPTPPTIIELTASDFTADKKVWSGTAMELIAANSYASVPDVVFLKPGDLIEWIDTPAISNTHYVAANYDAEGNPVVVKSSVNRWQYSDIKTNMYRTVLNGVYNIGFIWPRAYLASWTEDSKIRITKYP